MGYQMGGVNFTFGNQLHDFVAVAGIDTAGLERQVLAIHPRKGQYLFRFVECANRNDGIGTGAPPCEFKRLLATGNFNDAVGPSILCQ